METKLFIINGQVLDASTGSPIANLKVEAWDKDTKYHDLLGIGNTDREGRFQIDFDSNYFGLDDRKGLPDIFFKIWLGRNLLLNTADSPLTNAGEKTEVTLKVGMPPPRPEGKDRVNTAQAFKAAEFFRDSDFSGAFADFRKKSGTSFGFISDMVMNSITKFDWSPVKKANIQEDEIVGKNTGAVRESLSSKQVEVAEVQPYNPKLNAASVQNIKTLPTNLKAGQKVRLFEENGKVRYYTVVKEEAPTTTGSGDSTAQKLEMKKMREDLIQTKQLIADKDDKIARLQEELNSFRKEQDEFRSVLKSDAFAKLLKTANSDITKKTPKKKPE